MPKKINPRHIPRSQADVDKAYKQGHQDAIQGALVIMLYTLKDKHGATDEELKTYAENFNYVIDSISKGYVTEKDLQTVIKAEYGITINEKKRMGQL